MMIPYATILGSLITAVVLFSVLGILHSKGGVQGGDDFFTARGSTGTGYLSATFMASFLGVFILFTPPEAGAIGGISAVVFYSLGLAGLYLAFLVLGPKIRRYLPHGSTLNDYVAMRYGRGMFALTFLISLFYMYVHLIAELTAIALLAREMAGVPMLLTASLVGIGALVYTTYGGLKASIFTDLIQMILVILLLVITGIGITVFVGSPTALIEGTRDLMPQLVRFDNPVGIEFGLTLMIAVMVANLFHQGYWQRIYAGSNDTSLRRALKISLILAVPIMLFTGLLGLFSTGLGYTANPSVALFAMIYSTFPAWLVLVLFILALVLVMSTVDTLLNALVTSLLLGSGKGRSTVEGKVHKNPIRWIGVGITLSAAWIASMGFSVLSLFLLADLLCAGLVIPLFYGLYDSRLSGKLALVASVIGVSTGVPFYLRGQLLISFLLPLLASAITIVIGLAFSAPKQREADPSV